MANSAFRVRRAVTGATWLTVLASMSSIAGMMSKSGSLASLAFFVCALVQFSLAISVQAIVIAIREGKSE